VVLCVFGFVVVFNDCWKLAGFMGFAGSPFRYLGFRAVVVVDAFLLL